ncbi:related to succinyl-coa ligase [Ceraceosorus bombacis]|uniref:Related to succinyl-coa ligase n=1 Tax=Ceraceosorus bombacis TaxID=401625 RepID=A0A0P1BD72_9BASI|nr:related to succinyl-coa ligase [Ceraceosorus bombacis]
MHARLSIANRTNIVAGTTSAKNIAKFSQDVTGGAVTHPELKVPLHATVRDAIAAHKEETGNHNYDATAVFVPPQGAADAILEAIENEIPLIVSVAEGIPTRDQFRVMAALHSQSKSRLVGANSPGYTCAYGPRLGIAPVAAALPGCIGIAARSGTLSYEAMGATKDIGIGQSYILGLGGDLYPGTRMDEALEFLLSEPTTSGIVLLGEVGGTMEEDVASYLHSLRPEQRGHKPIVGFIAGRGVPQGLRNYGHAGAFWTDNAGDANSKRQMWKDAGIIVVDRVGDTATAVRDELCRLRQLPDEVNYELRTGMKR